ncbi:MAG: hypothetical protein U9Q68_07565 [Euryarchaeota archaeon]|nr:hypothetical protein [Euryarchaeota archaeon]
MTEVSSADVEMVTIPRHIYESPLETLETLSDRVEIESIKKGIKDIRNDRVFSEEEFMGMYQELLA